MSESYDWADDASMSAEETVRHFEALNPTPTTGPPVRLANHNLTVSFDHAPAVAVTKPSTSGSYDERREAAPDSTRQAFEPRQPVLVGDELVPTS